MGLYQNSRTDKTYGGGGNVPANTHLGAIVIGTTLEISQFYFVLFVVFFVPKLRFSYVGMKTTCFPYYWAQSEPVTQYTHTHGIVPGQMTTMMSATVRPSIDYKQQITSYYS